MSWTWNYPEQLRNRVEEIQDLWDKEQQHSFAKVTQDSNNSKCHPREITKGVSNKY